jgi:hypothetical protein
MQDLELCGRSGRAGARDRKSVARAERDRSRGRLTQDPGRSLEWTTARLGSLG